MSTVLLLVTSIWTFPYLFKGYDIVIEDGLTNATTFETFVQQNITTSEDFRNVTATDEMSTFPTTPTGGGTLWTETSLGPDQDDPSTIVSVAETTEEIVDEVITTMPTTSDSRTTTVSQTSTRDDVIAVEAVSEMVPPESVSSESMPQANPGDESISVTENTALMETYGEPCGFDKGLQCDESVKCRGKGTVNCNVADDLKSSRRNVSIVGDHDEESTVPPKTAAQFTPECRVEGMVICFPPPNIMNCKGQGTCVPVSEQHFGPRDLADWEVAVITVLCVVGLLLIFLLVYIMYSSFKKLKVQPDSANYPSTPQNA